MIRPSHATHTYATHTTHREVRSCPYLTTFLKQSIPDHYTQLTHFLRITAEGNEKTIFFGLEPHQEVKTSLPPQYGYHGNAMGMEGGACPQEVILKPSGSLLTKDVRRLLYPMGRREMGHLTTTITRCERRIRKEREKEIEYVCVCVCEREIERGMYLHKNAGYEYQG